MKNTNHNCGKWDHDFSYKGKKSCNEIKCRCCGIKMVDWVAIRKEELDKRIDCAGRSIRYCRGPATNAYG